jgi:DNA-binding transcriptional MerR regulator
MRGVLSGYVPLTTLAEELGVTIQCINRYTKQPDGLPVMTVGGRKYFKRADVDAWLERRTRRPNPVRKPR